MSEDQTRRAEDKGFWCVTARRFAEVWDFIDARDIDKHAVSVVVLIGTWELTQWAMKFAQHGDRPGLEVAAIIASVTGPYVALQAAAIAFYFKSRTE